MQGKVKMFNQEKGYGFITIEGGKDVFFHYSQLVMEGYKTIDNEVSIAVSVNGKLRSTIKVGVDMDKDELIKLAKEQENVKKYIDGHDIIKEIVVPNKIVNIVIK